MVGWVEMGILHPNKWGLTIPEAPSDQELLYRTSLYHRN